MTLLTHLSKSSKMRHPITEYISHYNLSQKLTSDCSSVFLPAAIYEKLLTEKTRSLRKMGGT